MPCVSTNPQIMNYKLPESLQDDITRFASIAKAYEQKEIDPEAFKSFRVPMGVYEQRQDDLYLARVRTTGGKISPDQLLELVEIAKRHDTNLLHITTRQEIQLQNLRLEHVEAVMLELQRIGLATKGGGGNTVRNMLVSEYSGISADEVFDTTPYAMALTTKLIAEPDSYQMPRKLKFAFSSDDKHIGYAAINDVGFVAKLHDGVRGFQVYAGGGGGRKPTVGWVVFDFVPATELYRVAEALKRFFSEHGDRTNRNKARLRFVFYELGEEETIRRMKEYYAEARKAEPELFLNDHYNARPPFTNKPADLPLDSEKYIEWAKRYVKPQRQNGYNTVLFPVLLGNIRLEDENKVESLKKLLSFINLLGDDTLRFTTSQSIRLRNIPDAALPGLFHYISNYVADICLPLIANNITSCTGADTCRLGICLSKGLASAIRQELLQSGLDLDVLQTTHIRISGCPNSCGLQLWGDIGFSGKVLRNDRSYPGYQVYLAAHRDVSPRFAEPVGSISAKDAPAFVRRLLEAYIVVATQYDSITTYLETAGKEVALQLLEEYKEIPSFAEDESYYSDWGADAPFRTK